MSDYERFGDVQLDVLKEIGNIGSGHAATALSRLLEKQVVMKVPDVRLVPFEEVTEQIGGSEAVVAAVFFRVSGDVPGNLLFILSVPSAQKLLSQVIGRDIERENEFTEMETSALAEIGNIMTGSYLSALADMTSLSLTSTPPSFTVDMAGAILSFAVLRYGPMGDHALLIETTFFDGGEQVEGNFLFIPDPEAFGTLFKALGASPK